MRRVAGTVDERLADERRQEFVENCRLVVPSKLASRGCEDRIISDATRARSIDEGVVRAQHAQMHLRHEQMRIVARLPDDRDIVDVPADVAVVHAKQELGRIVATVEKRMPDRPIAIQPLEIQPRCARVL